MFSLEINSRLWSDERFIRLERKLGSRRVAIGLLIDFWYQAKNLWLKGIKELSKEQYLEIDPDKVLIVCEFAKESETGVYCKGAGRRFKKALAVKANGLKGGRPKAVGRKPTSNLPVTYQQPTRLLTDDVKPAEGLVIKEIISLYCEFYKKRYGANPVFTGKNTGIIKRLLKDLGYKKLTMMLQVYLQMNDQWFLKRHHDLTTFEQSLQKIAVATQTGKDPDAKEDMFSFFNKKKLEVQL